MRVKALRECVLLALVALLPLVPGSAFGSRKIPLLPAAKATPPEAALKYGRSPQRRLPRHANDPNAELHEQLGHDRTQRGKHLDILVSVEVRGPQAVIADQLHLLLQLRPNGRVEPVAVAAEPGEQSENAGKAAGRVE